MTTRKVGARRLLKLADKISEAVKAKAYQFDLRRFVGLDQDGPEERVRLCGTAGCAVGYCPRAFPKDWTYVDVYPRLRRTRDEFSFEADAVTDSREYFGLESMENHRLFMPSSYVDENPEGECPPVPLSRVLRRIRTQAKKMLKEAV